MENGLDIQAKADALRTQLHAQLGFKGRDLAHALKRAGRTLPNRIRIKAADIVNAQQYGGNPKLEKRLDAPKIETSFREVSDYLASIDKADLRRQMILNRMAAVAANILVVLVGFIVWLWWSGHV
ncbi:MAG: hypothetical protein WBC93_03995 [Sulfitobacter sp.]